MAVSARSVSCEVHNGRAKAATVFVFFDPAWNAFAGGIARTWRYAAGIP